MNGSSLMEKIGKHNILSITIITCVKWVPYWTHHLAIGDYQIELNFQLL
jgi:hypothetical protein